jgi:peroxiredoxin
LRDNPWPDNVWSGLNCVAALNDLAIQQAAAPDAKPDLAVLTARIDAIAGRAPGSPYRVFLEQEYIRQLERHDPAALEPHLMELSASDIPDLAALGKGQLAIQQLRTSPMEMKFTALDGREVDLAKLRGKVVLIDFWATWCVPCVKQLPNVKAAYDKYHDRGFEVIGISSDRPADLAKLKKFIADQNLPWPQYFNDKGGRNPYAARYDIRSIPATFLLDRAGLLVTTETHDEHLEAALAKLFALQG